MASTTDLRAKVHDWVQWVRMNLDLTGEIPPVTQIEVTGLWNEDVDEFFFSGWETESRHELLSCFEEVLAPNPADIPTRFTALHLYRSLATTPLDPEIEEFGLIREQAESAQAAFEQDLGYLVRLLPVEVCPPDWRTIRWEILNSYLTRDWQRALALYHKAEALHLLESTELQALRGQFRFLLVFESEIQELARQCVAERKLDLRLESLEWKPRIYESRKEADQFCSVFLLAVGLCDRTPARKLSDSDRDSLLEAALDLERAISKRPALPGLYRAMLARCHFCTDHFSDAATQYLQLLKTDLGLFKNLKPRIYESLAVCHQRAGELQKAERALQQCLGEFPDLPETYLKLAEVQAKQAEFDAVASTVRKAMERAPDLDRDWKLSSLLALGETRDVSDTLLAQLKKWSSGEFDSIHAFLEDYWTPFKKMGEGARDKWVAGTLLLHFSPQHARLLPLRLREAAVFFATAVEQELYSKFFSRFGEFVRTMDDLRLLAEQHLEDKEAGVFCQFLVRNRPLTLGSILRFLHECESASEGILWSFREWLKENRFPAETLPLLDEICPIRNKALHRGQSLTNIQNVPMWCRQIMDLILNPPK